MSDQSPPSKPKPGSLRDRIAAFENKGGSTPGAPPGPPLPRPKPGGLQWKPKPPSPPTSPDHSQSGDKKPPNTAGMSASDAMESIGRGGSLKERMAALQGKGAFGSAPPPVAPKPNVERPKWKPPPTVPAQASTEDEPKEGIVRVDLSGHEASRSPPPRVMADQIAEEQRAPQHDGDMAAQEGDGMDLDQEEERQRRAAIAARMARLGGARIGMGPPIFAPKPVAHKSEPALPAPAAREEAFVDQPTVVKESSTALSPSPAHNPSAAASPVLEPAVETERRDEPDSPTPAPTRAPTSMPIPAGPRRAVPPRKKASKPAPVTTLPEPPLEETAGAAVQSPPITDEPPAISDRVVHDTPLTTGDSQEIGEVPVAVESTYEKHLCIATDPEEHPTSPSISTEVFHMPVEEHEEQEAEERLVEGEGSYVEQESMHTVTDDQQVPSSHPPDVAEADEEDEEARRHRVASKLAQMGAFNPFAGPPPVPQHLPIDEPATAPSEERLGVENEDNIDTAGHGETISSPPTVPARHDSAHFVRRDAAEQHGNIEQDDPNVDEDDQVPAHRDGERTVASFTGEQGDGHDGYTLPHTELSEEQSAAYDAVCTATEQERVTASDTREAEAFSASGTTLPASEAQGRRLQGDLEDPITSSTAAEIERDTLKDEVADEGVSPPRITRSIPPPPVNLRSKPTSPTSPPLSPPPPKTPLQTLRADEEERPASPDMPPRPIPPPGRSGSMMEDAPSPPPRRSIPHPTRRTSARVTDSLAETPFLPAPAPTSPRPVHRGPVTPHIFTTLATQEQATSEEQENEDTSESGTPQPEAREDEESARRRAIAERMARLGGIRFGAPPQMNPLSRPPLPAAPPPTSIPPDETESEGKEEGDEGDEAARRQRFATKLAGMGGMRFGMLPPGGFPSASAERPVARQEDSENEDSVPPVPVPAPPHRPPPNQKPPPPVQVSTKQELEKVASENRGTSDDGVRVEAEESEMEEVRYSDAEAALASEGEDTSVVSLSRRSMQASPHSAEALPTPPPRMTSRSPPLGRPPIPMIPPALLGRRPSAMTGTSSRQTSVDESSPGEASTISGRATESGTRPQFEYVMVEAEDPDEDDAPAPPPRRKSTRGPARSIPLPPPPPPSAIDPPETLAGSVQWELPSIPQGVEFREGSEIASSGWSEDSTVVQVPQPLLSSPPGSRRASGKPGLPSSTSVAGSGRRSVDQQQQLTADELMAIWGKVGVQVVSAATTLFEKSKRVLVGDGSYGGFVRAVLAQVPGVVVPHSTGDDDWGYIVYAQTGNAVQRRVSDILPGDIIAFSDAKLKGHKGLHAYTQTIGVSADEGGRGPLVGVVSEFEGKKSKVRVWQANQHVGQQTVENVSYRLEDLKSGEVKVYRILEA